MALNNHVRMLIRYAVVLAVIPAFCVFSRTNAAASGNGHSGIEISEVMAKNTACLCDEDGEFPDWVELHNCTGKDIDISGWALSDRGEKRKLVFDRRILASDEYIVVKLTDVPNDGFSGESFSVSEGETVYLVNSAGETECQLCCEEVQKNCSLIPTTDGKVRTCRYPTPGRENTKAAYDELQESTERSSPILINEVVVADADDLYGRGDWFELKNVSGETVELKNWTVSDDSDNYRMVQLPNTVLNPGELAVFSCDDYGLALNSKHEELFLTDSEGKLADWMPLMSIPNGGSFGRMDGKNGTFYFAKATPEEENAYGKRRVSEAPVLLGRDGVFENVGEISVEFESDGTVYYHIGATLPTEESEIYRSGFTISKTSTIRAFAEEENALPSSCVTFHYIINRHHSLPVLCLTSDHREEFNTMYGSAIKNSTVMGNLAFYEDNGSFSMPCEIKMHGDTSLVFRKKGMSVRFRGPSGNDTLEYDLFQGGVTSFTNLNLRGGSDQNYFIIRNELCENLALAASDNIVGTRSRYCVLYMNNEYYGIYALSEKTNEQHYANLLGVDEDCVRVVDYEVPRNSSLYKDVFEFCYQHDMRKEENYQHFCELMDVESLIDWMFLEGYFANSDLTFGNLKFCRSTEGDTRWKFILYDLDATFVDTTLIQLLFLRPQTRCYQVNQMVMSLLKNKEFRASFLERAGELLNGPLSEERVLEEIERLAEEIDSEVERDRKNTPQTYRSWKSYIEVLKANFTEKHWNKKNVQAICKYLNVTAEEKELYFSKTG